MTSRDVDSLFSVFIETALPKGAWVVALHHVYFDESGTHDGSPIMSVGGYVFKAEQAARFSRDWEKELRRFGLPFAHQTDCATGNGVYRDMTKDQRILVQKRLIENIKRRSVLGFSATMDPTHFEQTMGKAKGLPQAYSFLVLVCIMSLNDWAKGQKGDVRFSFFLEAGHKFQKEANAILNGLATPPESDDYRYIGHGFFGKSDAPPLQAADMLAWFARQFFVRKSETGITRMRRDFAALLRPQDFNRDVTESWLEELRDGFAEAMRRKGVHLDFPTAPA